MQTCTLAWQVREQQQKYTITAGRRCVIGRHDRYCDIVLPEATVSRQHAAIEMVGETFHLSNVSKTSLVYFNEQTRLSQQQSMPLKPGDIFRVGPITFTVLRPTRKTLKLRCAHCDRLVEYTPEAFCPWCGRALSNGESIIVEE